MKAKTILLSLIAPIALFATTSCNKEGKDGDWEPMKWTKNTYATQKYADKTYYQVPSTGGSFTFTCKNYEKFWLSSVNITSAAYGYTVEKHIADGTYGKWDGRHYDDERCSIDISDNVLTVKFQQSDSSLCTYKIVVTAGDIFHSFQFLQ